MADAFQAEGSNSAALFSLRVHRGDGMVLLGMNWKQGTPSRDFVGFAIEYREPGGDRFFAVRNRLAFPGVDGSVNSQTLSSKMSPIQLFRWVHFPRNAHLEGQFVYRVTPMFMNSRGELSEGEPQTAALELRRETWPGRMNISFTRGFVSSQAFVDRYGGNEAVRKLLPSRAEDGLQFKPTHADAEGALEWMGFEAREVLLQVLDEAIADPTAKVYAVLFDLNEPSLVERYCRLGKRLKIVIDDDGTHGAADSPESQAAARLERTAGAANVVRHHMGGLQHNKMLVVDGKNPVCVCGSTNHSWRGLYVQNNHLVVLRGRAAVKVFASAAERYFSNPDGKVKAFSATDSAEWNDLKLRGIDARVTFSPHSQQNTVLSEIAEDISAATSSVLFSLAFLYQTEGVISEAIAGLGKKRGMFCCGISDKPVKGLSGGVVLQGPDGIVDVIGTAQLQKSAPEPFHSEASGGSGVRMHHKFVVLDFDKPTARVYFGSYNFSKAADEKNGENLLLVRDRRVATSFAIEALRIFDHYQFRVKQQQAETAQKVLQLKPAPATKSERPWWSDWYSDKVKIRDRELFG